MSKKTAERSVEFLRKERKRIRDYRIENSNIPEQYFGFSWSDYKSDHDFSKEIKSDTVKSSREAAKIICASYARDLEIASKTGKSLFLIGKRTSGKTVLATLILRTAIDRLLQSVYYVPFSTFAMEANTANLDEEREVFEDKYIDPQFLCIDEIEEMDSNPKIRNYFGTILIQRQKEHKPTIITSKISLQKIREIYGNLVFSALTNSEFFFNPIAIETEDVDAEDTVWIKAGRRYSITMIIDELQKLKEIKTKNKKTKKEINPDYVFSDELERIIVQSDKAGSLDGELRN